MVLPGAAIQAGRGLSLHRFVYDGISAIDRFRLVPDDRHGNRSRHTSALERADDRPARAVRKKETDA